jgi:zinc transport system substrate-binding protein
MLHRLTALALGTAIVAGLAGCGSASGWTTDEGRGRVRVVAAFYALQYAAQQVGGEHVDVAGLTRPGAEPHDLELTPRQVGRVATADLVVYERGFQPAVDVAVSDEARGTGFDVSPAADLDLAAPAEDGGHDHDEGAVPSAEPEHHADAHVPGSRDPHFWLDPLRFADVGDAIAAQLAARDPRNAAAYRANATTFRARMVSLDEAFRTGLAHCRVRDLVTSHAAFGYLAERYGLHQEGISGLDPEAEPDPATLARVAAHVRESGATTVYADTLVSRAVASTLARETGARLAVLDPLEGITEESAGTDYPSVMRANLATLRTGQECS